MTKQQLLTPHEEFQGHLSEYSQTGHTQSRICRECSEIPCMIITRDVFEHVLNPDQAFSEVARILKPGGAHVFTVPWYKNKPTLVRARQSGGTIEYLETPEYHGNLIDPNGSLFVREWGHGLVEYIRRHSGLETEVYLKTDRRLGLDGEFLEVFVARKK